MKWIDGAVACTPHYEEMTRVASTKLEQEQVDQRQRTAALIEQFAALVAHKGRSLTHSHSLGITIAGDSHGGDCNQEQLDAMISLSAGDRCPYSSEPFTIQSIETHGWFRKWVKMVVCTKRVGTLLMNRGDSLDSRDYWLIDADQNIGYNEIWPGFPIKSDHAVTFWPVDKIDAIVLPERMNSLEDGLNAALRQRSVELNI
ncbi:hypothetical protein [Allobranchiibius sp. GilTou38]|uniref:hypothetical protein n=1 Tax=Allobranchiibius sp. GilTou38 TaxID=2815210 RepID=UPI001AA16452|nr:hypothetical protein [Allobranchiibius sp. GilTou38]MBO1765790.1 hypothetical protein [Allobranchiibius sp. GilTou38]